MIYLKNQREKNIIVIFSGLQHLVERCVIVLVVVVTNSLKHDFSRYKSVVYKFLSRDTKSARDKTTEK